MTIRAATLLVVTTVLASSAGDCAAEGKSMYTKCRGTHLRSLDPLRGKP